MTVPDLSKIDDNSKSRAFDVVGVLTRTDPARRLQEPLPNHTVDAIARVLRYIPSTGVAMNRPDTMAELLVVIARMGDRLTQALQEHAVEEEKHRTLRNDVAAMRRLMFPEVTE